MAEKQKALERELAMMEEEEKEKESGNKGIGIDFPAFTCGLEIIPLTIIS